MDKKFFVGIYCPPYPPKQDYPSRITEKSYSLLKDIGVTDVFGHFEDKYDWSYLEQAMDLCDKVGLNYYPRLFVFQDYISVTGGYPDEKHISYRDLSSAEQDELNKKLVSQLNKIKDHKCFSGVFFGDESPRGSFYGMGVAKRVFKENFPDKEFHYNCLNYCISDEHMFGGKNSKDFRVLTGDMSALSQNRFKRYRYLLDCYLDEVKPEYLTTDLYPFTNYWKGLPTVHRGLYELNSLIAEYKRLNKNLKSYYYLQTGSWDNDVRKVNRAEMALQMNITLAYGHEGFCFFPGVFPNDFLYEKEDPSKNGDCALLDCYGEPTVYAEMSKQLLAEVQAFAPVLLSSEFEGVTTAGSFHGGFDGIDITYLADYDAIYNGSLPEWCRFEGTLPMLQTDSQLFIGVFSYQGKKAYLVVNNSIVCQARFAMRIDKWEMVFRAQRQTGENLIEMCLPQGESVLIVEN